MFTLQQMHHDHPRRRRGAPQDRRRESHYLDGLELFGRADAGDAADDLQPDGVGYVRIGRALQTRRAFGAGRTATAR